MLAIPALHVHTGGVYLVNELGTDMVLGTVNTRYSDTATECRW